MRTQQVTQAMTRARLAAGEIEYLRGQVDELDRLWRGGALSNAAVYSEAQRLTFGEPVEPAKSDA